MASWEYSLLTPTVRQGARDSRALTPLEASVRVVIPRHEREKERRQIALGVFLMIRTTRSSSIPFLLCASVALFLPYDYYPRSTLTKMMMMGRGGWCSSCYCLVHWAICSVKWSRFGSKRTRLETRPTWYWTLGQFGTKPSQFPDISS